MRPGCGGSVTPAKSGSFVVTGVLMPFGIHQILSPLFMSYAAVSHVQYRLTEQGRGTLLTLTHRAIGEIPQEHRDGVGRG